MDSYRILWKRSAERDLRGIERQHVPRIIKAIELLPNNPFPSQCCKLKDTEDFYRIRVGDHRIIYHVEFKTNTIIIFYIRHRKKAYKRLK